MRYALLLTAFAMFGHAAAPEPEIEQAERAWAAAVKGRDFAALERLITPQMIYAHSTGAVENKAEYIGRLRSGAQRYDGIDYQSVTVRWYWDAAVTHSLVHMTGVSNGKPFNDRLMVLHLWVRRDGRWQLAAHQSTKLQ